MLWVDLIPEQWDGMLKETNYTCVFDIGCVENHGLHMPLGCDTQWGGDMVEDAAEKAGVCVFPRLYFGDLVGCRRSKYVEGTKFGEGAKPGYIALSSQLLMELLEECCDEIARNGFKKVIVVSSHGGNTPLMRFFERSMGMKKRDYEVFTMDIELYEPRKILADIEAGKKDKYPRLTDADIAVLQDYADNGGWDGHGGLVECAYMMATRPEYLRIDKCNDTINNGNGKGNPVIEKKLDWNKLWGLHHPHAHDGYSGAKLTPNVAHTLYELERDRVADVFKFVKDDPRMQALIEEVKDFKE